MSTQLIKPNYFVTILLFLFCFYFVLFFFSFSFYVYYGCNLVIENLLIKKQQQQQGIQYLGVHPTASSALSSARTLLFGLRLDHLNTNDVVKCPFVMITHLENFKTRCNKIIPVGILIKKNYLYSWLCFSHGPI